MNSDFSPTPSEEREARLTALLLGELSAEEAAEVQRALAADADLARLHDQLKRTISLVREVASDRAEPATIAPLSRLSPQRREKLLAHFKTVAPEQFAGATRQTSSWFVPVAAAALLLLLVALAAIPNFSRARNTSQSNAIINNLRLIDGAKQQWALENKKADTDTPTLNDLRVYVKGSEFPQSISGETYVLGKVGESPAAEIGASKAKEWFRRSATRTRAVDGERLRLTLPDATVTVAASSLERGRAVEFLPPPPPPPADGVHSANVAGHVNVSPDAINAIPASPAATPPIVSSGKAAAEFAAPALRAEIVLPSVIDSVANGRPIDSAVELQKGNSVLWGADPKLAEGATVVQKRFYQVSGGVGGGGKPAPAQTAPGAPAPSTENLAGDFLGAAQQPAIDLTTGLPVTAPGIVSQPESGRQLARIEPRATEKEMENLNEKLPALADLSSVERLDRSGLKASDAPGQAAAKSDESQKQLPAEASVKEAERKADFFYAGVTDNFATTDFDTGKPPAREAEKYGFGLFGRDATVEELAPRVDSLKNEPELNRVRTRNGDDLSKPGNLGDGVDQRTWFFDQRKLAEEKLTRLQKDSSEYERTEKQLQELSQNLQELDREKASSKTRPYFEARRELGQLVNAGRVLETKLASDKTDLSLPRSTSVDVIDMAEPSKEKSGFWRNLGVPFGGEYASAARIRVRPDLAGPQGQLRYDTAPAHDHHFVLNEFETITSETVLGKVVDSLELDKAWAKKGTGERLNKEQAISRLRQKLDVHSVPNTSLVEIRSISDDASEAARIANAVAQAYKEQRQQTGQRSSEVKALEDRVVEQREKIRVAQANVEALRQELASSEAEAGGRTSLIEFEALRPLQAQLIEDEAQYLREQRLLTALKPLSREELRKVLPATARDELLRQHLTDLGQAENKLVAVKQHYGPESPELQQIAAQVEDLTKKVNARIEGIMTGLQQSVDAKRVSIDKRKADLENARKVDLEKAAKSQPYWAKKQELEQLTKQASTLETDLPVRKPSTNAPIPQPEIQTCDNAFSTFSLNVSDVSFKLAMASLEQGQMPDAASVRSEEFINAFDYRDPEPAAGAPIAFAWERARYPFAHNRDLLRFSLKTAAAGRQAGRPLNIVLLLDNSGSMERADRVRIIREALRVLAGQLQPQDKLSVITFARTARLVADGISGDKAGEVADQVSGLTPQGGTNLEDAMNLAYQTAAKHYLTSGINRVVLLTDGAANLGNVEPESLKQKVEAQRKQGIALDCFGIGWEGFNDDLLEVLSRNGDGRYGFINSPEEAATDFVGQLAGALKVAASDVKVQVEFNPKRTTSYRQIGYAKHQLTKEQFRDNTVDAAEIAAQEAGNALYTAEVNPAGEGPLCTVRVRYKIPGTQNYREQAWDVPYTGNAISLEQSTPAMRLAASTAAFADWLVASPFAGEVTLDRVLGYVSGVPEVYGADSRPKKLEWMIRQARSIEGK